MAERGFLDQNDLIAYPLVDGDGRGFVEGGVLPKRGLTDAKFMLGVGSGFRPVMHNIFLYQFFFWSADMYFDFRSYAPGMAGYRFYFHFGMSSPFGSVVRATASLIDPPYTENPLVGEGAIVLGDLSDLRLLGGYRTLSSLLRVEPALIISLYELFTGSINLANQRRPCPTVCGAAPVPVSDTRCPYVRNLVGSLKFREGYNSKVSLLEDSNTIQLEAVLGGGAGYPCHDRIIDEPESSSSGDPECDFREDDCVSCDGLIKSFNGVTCEDGRFMILAGQGVQIVDDPSGHKITVKLLEDERICRSSSSI